MPQPDVITERVKQILSEKYDPDSICVYHMMYQNAHMTRWRVEAEAYIDDEDGPYFFIFEGNEKSIRYRFNESRFPNNHECLGAEIPPKG